MNKALIVILSLLVMASCGNKQTVVKDSVVTKEQISFPIGERIDNPAFTGEAYLKPLINVDSVFNFPAPPPPKFE